VPADTPPFDWAAEILAENLDAEALKDVPALVDLVQTARRVTDGTGLSAFRTEGLRRRQPVGSPAGGQGGFRLGPQAASRAAKEDHGSCANCGLPHRKKRRSWGLG
jgi:hypothetical protein